MKTILIMGLPGSGKTTLAKVLLDKLRKIVPSVEWINADKVRQEYNDWDFTTEGRNRQMKRMRSLADEAIKRGSYVICDFVCPTKALRKEFNADFVVWMNTLNEGRFEDTNKIFEVPESDEYNLIVNKHEWWNMLYSGLCANQIIDRMKISA